MDELSLYDYALPTELIAHQPAPDRDASRLLVVDRRNHTLSHRSIRDLPELLNPGDCLVMNDTRVVAARLLGFRTLTGGKWEGLYLSSTDDGLWRILSQTRGKLVAGEQINVTAVHGRDGETLQLTLVEREDGGVWRVEPGERGSAPEILARFGTVPLPPYIERDVAKPSDWERYQTVFAQRPGAVAAPTAGLHFTPELLKRCDDQGVNSARVTLHVGIGTFRPVTAEKLSEHQMHSEWCEVSPEAAATINAARANGGRLVAIGTTTIRTLESASRDGVVYPWSGATDLFIRPPYQFQAIDVLLTNFHLPRSTLLVLVSTFAGRELIQRAYETAIRERYRFFSYGDAMLIL